MHREGSAACNWPLALLVFSLISVLYVSAAIAAPALIVTPPTLTPDKVVSIPGGTCANYSNTVSTSGVVDPNGIHHPGECQLTDFEVLFEGLPFKQYWRNVSFGRLPAPYTVTRVGPFCYEATNLHVHISARAQTSRLNWLSVKPAASVCMKEWSREQTAVSKIWPNSMTLAATVLSEVSRTFAPTKRQECGAQAPVGVHGTSPQRRLANWAEKSLSSVNATAQADFASVSRRFETATAQAACALHCNVCDFSGWAGTITMTATMTGPKHYSQSATETYFVGGPSTPQGNQTLYPAEWDLTQSGQWADAGYTASWQLNASSPVSCAPQDVCFAEVIDAPSNKLSFAEISSPLQLTNSGQLVQVDPNGQSTTTRIEAFEIQPQLHGITFQGTANTTALTGNISLPSVPEATCNGVQSPGGSTCKAQWSWDLSKQ